MEVRGLRAGDEPEVRRVFRDTVALGRPLPADWDLDRYEALCLGWYLTAGRDDAAVLIDGGTVVGYALVCTRPEAHARWVRRAGARWAGVTLWRLGTGRLRGAAARFHRLRLVDGWTALRRPVVTPYRAHCHLNMSEGARGASGGRALARHVDARCRAAGLDGWFGEVNRRPGARFRAFEATGGGVAGSIPNRTLSWLAGTAVTRHTVLRRVPPEPVDGMAEAADRMAEVR